MNEELIYQKIKEYKNDILEYGDWWWGFDTHSVNVHCLDDENWEEPNAIFSINVYEVGANGMDDYSTQYDLPTMTRKEIRLL